MTSTVVFELLSHFSIGHAACGILTLAGIKHPHSLQKFNLLRLEHCLHRAIRLPTSPLNIVSFIFGLLELACDALLHGEAHTVFLALGSCQKTLELLSQLLLPYAKEK